MSSYPRPIHTPSWQLRALPLLPPSHPPPADQLQPPPPLPTPLRPALDCILPGFTLSTHLIPAAFPRSTHRTPLPVIPDTETKEERKARAARLAREFLERALHYRAAQDDASRRQAPCPDVLWSCLNRFVRTGAAAGEQQQSLTLFCAHANGLTKETYEHALRELVARAEADARYAVDEIWILEAVNHGDSALVNEGRLHTLLDWKDHARDQLNFLLHYLPARVSPEPLPTHLPRLPPSVADAPRVRGIEGRTIVGVGHSFGGCTQSLVAYTVPALFSALVLLDPVIAPPGEPVVDDKGSLAYGALSRREAWPSRKEALRLLGGSPFFGAWDPEVLKLYVDYGLTEDAKGGVRLKTSGVQEAATFADTWLRCEMWGAVPKIEERIALRWLSPEDAKESIGKTEEIEQQRVWLRPANASNVRVMGATHLMVQERPREVADAIHSFLLERYGTMQARL